MDVSVDNESKLQTLWDERSITSTMLRFGHSLDVEDWEAHASCFTDPVNIDFRKFTGLDEIRLSPVLWAQFAAFILGSAPRHHLLGSFEISIEGDRAWATVDMISSLWSETPSGLAANRQYGWFTVAFARQGDEWKISRIKHDYQGVDGNAAKLDIQSAEFVRLSQEVFSPPNMAAARAYLAEVDEVDR
jgi:SnoaL-like domain